MRWKQSCYLVTAPDVLVVIYEIRAFPKSKQDDKPVAAARYWTATAPDGLGEITGQPGMTWTATEPVVVSRD